MFAWWWNLSHCPVLDKTTHSLLIFLRISTMRLHHFLRSTLIFDPPTSRETLFITKTLYCTIFACQIFRNFLVDLLASLSWKLTRKGSSKDCENVCPSSKHLEKYFHPNFLSLSSEPICWATHCLAKDIYHYYYTAVLLALAHILTKNHSTLRTDNTFIFQKILFLSSDNTI